MKAILPFIAFALFATTQNNVFCQYRELSFNHLSVDKGLSQGVNNCLFQDSRNYTWISSFDGLNRFDGINCIVYRNNPSDSNSVKGTLFLNILEDVNNNLWIGSNEGLNFYDRKTNRFRCYYSQQDKFANQTYSPFYIDNDNNIWLQSGQNILLFNSSTKQFRLLYHFVAAGNLIIKTNPAVQLQPLQQIFAVSRGDAGIYSAPADKNQLSFSPVAIDGSFKAGINSFLFDEDGWWIGTNEGLFHQTGSGLKKISLHTERNAPINILYLHTDKKNILWAATEKDGIICINKKDSTVQKQFINSAYNPYSLSGNQAQYIYTDKQNNLWVAVWGKGADYVNLEKFRFQHFLTSQETSALHLDNFIRSITEVLPNKFWCGTQQNGILVLDENKKITGRITNDLPPSIEHIYKDHNGKIWIATFAGLFTADARTGVVQKVNGFENLPIPAKQFNYIYQLQNQIMLASSNAGIFFIKPNGNNYSILPARGSVAGDVYLTSYQTNNGDIYLCRAFKGFSVYNLQGDSLILKKDFYNQSTVKCFYETADSILWIAGTKGLIKFNKKNLSIVETYTTNNGLPNQYVYGILANGDDLWLSTNAGISRFNTTDNSIKNFTAGDGLQSNEFNTYSFCQSASGELLFGGVNGITAFYPAQIKKDTSSPQILLQHILVNDTAAKQQVSPEELRQLELQYSENTVSFLFGVIDYTNPAKCSYLYKLEGYDKDWIHAANKSLIRYANLPPGSYTLKAKAVSAEGIISATEYSLKIHVATPWYKTWWFSALVFIAAGLLVFYFIKSFLEKRYQKQKLLLEKELAIEQERTRMARELHDGLGSMLSGLKHSFSALQNQVTLDKGQEEKFNLNIDRLNESIKELRNISNSMYTDNSLKFGLENSLKDYCHFIGVSSGLQVSFYALEISGIILSEEQSFHIFRIVQELLQNIIKHAAASNIIVQLIFNSGRLYVTVEDDGKGFDFTQGKATGGMGLKNIEARVKMLNGAVDYVTDDGKGTSVTIEIPCKVVS